MRGSLSESSLRQSGTTGLAPAVYVRADDPAVATLRFETNDELYDGVFCAWLDFDLAALRGGEGGDGSGDEGDGELALLALRRVSQVRRAGRVSW